MLDTLRGHFQVGLEQLELESDAAGFAAQHELGIGEGEAVRVRIQRVARDGKVVELRPGVGQAAVIQVGIGFHENSCCRWFSEKKG
ncbi:hypothetical protein D3C81_2074660 [compost metagenome]